jgi:hypothetical protein
VAGVGASVLSVAEAVPTVVAVAVAVVFPSILGFDDAAPPFPPFPFVPFGGDDLRDEDEFAVKYLYLFPFPSPLPPDLEEKNEKARTCRCVACVVVDVDVAAAVEASETAGRVATSRANICGEIQMVSRKRVVRRCGSPPSDTGFPKRYESRGHRSDAPGCRVTGTIDLFHQGARSRLELIMIRDKRK